MSKLEELIQQYCPDGVEYVRFVDYANVLYGCPFNAAQFTNDSSYIPLIRIRDVLSGKASTYYKGEYSHDYIIKKGDILVGMDGNFNLGIWDDIDGLLCQRVCKLYTKDETRLLNGFIRHYMKPVFRQIEEGTPGGSVKHLSAKAINSIHIPLPPLPVQEEIVRILDNFTELQAELQKRKLQYNYYLDNLLNFNRGGYQAEVRWMKMNDIAKLSRGRVISKDYLQNNAGIYPVYSSQTANNGELGQINTYDYNGNYLTWTTDGAYAGTIFKRKGCFNITNVCGLIALTSELVNLDYLYYWLKITAPSYVYKGMGNSKLMSNVMESILIPIIPLSEQQRIVSILDRFDRLTNDLTAGLPAEIAKRRQQYEYYRDKLLTFKRKAA